MKYSVVAVIAAVAGVQASAYGNVSYTTEVVTALTTYCPFATQITHGGSVYTVSEPTTLVITNCPCTVTKPVVTASAVVCNTCTSYSNSTTAAPTTLAPSSTGSTPIATASSSTPPTSVPTAGAGKVVALSGGALAGLLGMAAFIL